jgi:outer membrane biosynthesis protein TonB
MMVEIWRDVIMKAVLERFSPVALKILSDERVQTLLTQALNLQADMRQNIEAQVKLVARTLELVTRDELSSLRIVVKNLEAEVGRLKQELVAEAARAARPARTATPEPAPAAAPRAAPKPKAAPVPKAAPKPKAAPRPKPAPAPKAAPRGRSKAK